MTFPVAVSSEIPNNFTHTNIRHTKCLPGYILWGKCELYIREFPAILTIDGWIRQTMYNILLTVDYS